MKQSKIISIYKALQRLSGALLAPTKAFAIYSMMKKLEPSFSFHIEQENKLIEQYHGEEVVSGQWQFENTEIKQKVLSELADLSNMDVDIELTPITIELSELGSFSISPNDIIALEGFVEFIE